MTVPNEDKVIRSIAQKEGFQVSSFSSLAGGSINQVHLLDTSVGQQVLKLNDPQQFPRMFSAEKAGLEALKATETFDIPKVFGTGTTESTAYILLEYKKEKPQKRHFWNLFAEDLAALHKNSRPHFGFEEDNYIGSLPQFNNSHIKAPDFYLSERLEPQIRMAAENGFSFQGLDNFYRNISEEIPEEPPALIHGDLWSGNYIVNVQGAPCLIDPAVSYAPREMDLAMMKLFGGFPEEVFIKYDEYFPLEEGFDSREEIWQLYYLLVHLNIFGSSYLPSVKRIISRFA